MFLKSLPAGWNTRIIPALNSHIKSAHAQTDHRPFGLSPDKCPFGKIFSSQFLSGVISNFHFKYGPWHQFSIKSRKCLTAVFP